MTDKYKHAALIGAFADGRLAGTHQTFARAGAIPLNAAEFWKTFQPNARRTVTTKEIGNNHQIIFYQLSEPTAVPVPVDQLQQLVPISLDEISKLSERQLNNAQDYANYGCELFSRLLNDLDTLAIYSHGDFVTALLSLGYTYITETYSAANWELNDEAADVLIAYLMATQEDACQKAKNVFEGVLKKVYAHRPDHVTGLISAAEDLRPQLHSVKPVTDQFKAAVKSLDWQNFTRFKSSDKNELRDRTGDFHSDFRKVLDSKTSVDSLALDVNKHAYIMLWLFSKYSSQPLEAGIGTKNPQLRDSIWQNAFADHEDRRASLPSGETCGSVATDVREGRLTSDELGFDQEVDKQIRMRSLESELIAKMTEEIIPRNTLSKEVFLHGAADDYMRSWIRVSGDSLLEEIDRFVLLAKPWCNKILLMLSSLEGKPDKQTTFATWITEQTTQYPNDEFLKLASQVLEQIGGERIFGNLFRSMVKKKLLQIREQVNQDAEGAAKTRIELARYRSFLGISVDSENVDTEVATTTAVAIEHLPDQTYRSDDLRQQRKERIGKKVDARKIRNLSTRERVRVGEITGATAVKPAESTGATVIATRLVGNEVQLDLAPVVKTVQDAKTDAANSGLSTTGSWFRGNDRIGTYELAPDNNILFTAEIGNAGPIETDRLVSTKAEVSSISITLEKSVASLSVARTKDPIGLKFSIEKLIARDDISISGAWCNSEVLIVDKKDNEVCLFGQPLANVADETTIEFEIDVPIDGDGQHHTVTLADTPTIADLEDEKELETLPSDMLDRFSRIAFEYESKRGTEQPEDDWFRSVRSRIFREHVLALSGSIPFDKEDLGVSFEAIARCVRHLGFRKDGKTTITVGEEETTTSLLKNLDLSYCFLAGKAADVSNIYVGYHEVCTASKNLDKFRAKLRAVHDLFEGLKESDAQITVYNSTLDKLPDLAGFSTRDPADLWKNEQFKKGQVGYVCVLDGTVEQSSYRDLDSALLRFANNKEDETVQFRYPLVFASQSVEYWWAVAPNFGELERASAIKQWDVSSGMSPSLLVVGALVGGEAFKLGKKRQHTSLQAPGNPSLGTEILFRIGEAAKASMDDNAPVSSDTLWALLAHQRAVNMALEWFKAPGRLVNNFGAQVLGGNWTSGTNAIFTNSRCFESELGSLPNAPQQRNDWSQHKDDASLTNGFSFKLKRR